MAGPMLSQWLTRVNRLIGGRATLCRALDETRASGGSAPNVFGAMLKNKCGFAGFKSSSKQPSLRYATSGDCSIDQVRKIDNYTWSALSPGVIV
jgi:hypothetical protein